MKIKVCGIKYEKNLKEILACEIDWVGFNFYSKSERFITNPLNAKNESILKVGVFVNAELEYINEKINTYKLDLVQLHGGESEKICREVQNKCPVIKVFSVDEDFDFKSTAEFDFCDYFLFDTKTIDYGGSGCKFNWEKLKEYDNKTPFLLAGGIGPYDIKEIKSISHLQLIGIDINSKFEIEPGEKDVNKIRSFIKELKNET